MSAVDRVSHDPAPVRHPLAPGATPEGIRENLLVEDRESFDEALCQAIDDEAALADTLEEWRCIAIVQRDREQFIRTARRVAEHVTGEPSPDDEPLAATRAKAGM